MGWRNERSEGVEERVGRGQMDGLHGLSGQVSPRPWKDRRERRDDNDNFSALPVEGMT